MDERQRERRRRRRAWEIRRNLILAVCLLAVIGGAAAVLSRVAPLAGKSSSGRMGDGNTGGAGETGVFTEAGAPEENQDKDSGENSGEAGAGSENGDGTGNPDGAGEGAGMEVTIVGSGTESQNPAVPDGDVSDGTLDGDSLDGEDPAAGEENWKLLLVNSSHSLPENYEVELTQLSSGESVDTRIYPALQKMFDDARAAGVYPVVVSGFRTAEKQQSLMDERVQEYLDQGYSADAAAAEARNWVALPGNSEHQLGSAVDINADGVYSYGDQVYSWLNENSWRYGFIQRYPEDKTDITGISYEPWHYRYVGEEAAAQIYEQGLCLEEYLEKN